MKSGRLTAIPCIENAPIVAIAAGPRQPAGKPCLLTPGWQQPPRMMALQQHTNRNKETVMLNPNVPAWFEIPANRLDRAQKFYETILDVQLKRENMGGGEMAVFPYGG